MNKKVEGQQAPKKTQTKKAEPKVEQDNSKANDFAKKIYGNQSPDLNNHVRASRIRAAMEKQDYKDSDISIAIKAVGLDEKKLSDAVKML